MTPSQEYIKALVDASKIIGMTTLNKDLLHDLFEFINPRYPRDSVRAGDALLFLWAEKLPPTPEEINILRTLLPNYAPWHIRVYAIAKDVTTPGVMVQFEGAPKRSGAFWRVFFWGKEHGLCFPLGVMVERYTDMDDLENHGDECPSRLPEDHAEYSDDCNCESQVDRTEKFEIPDATHLPLVKAKIERALTG